MSTPEQTSSDLIEEVEVCPSCGKWAVLHEVTGWCYLCSGATPPTNCERCGYTIYDGRDKYCNSCRYMRWLERNADEIERIMVSFEVSAGRAKVIVRNNNRPKCLSCGKPIKGGIKDKNFFCRKTSACKTGHNSYHYHRTAQRRSRADALNLAVIAASKARLIHVALVGEDCG